MFSNTGKKTIAITFAIATLIISFSFFLEHRKQTEEKKVILEHARKLAAFKANDWHVTALAFSTDDALLAAEYGSGAINIWNTKTWDLLHTITLSSRKRSLKPEYGKLIFTSSTTLVVALNPYSDERLDEQASIKIIDAPSGRIINELQTNDQHRIIGWTRLLKIGDSVVIDGAYKTSNTYRVSIRNNNFTENIDNDLTYLADRYPVTSGNRFALESPNPSLIGNNTSIALTRIDTVNTGIASFEFPYAIPSDTSTLVDINSLAITKQGDLAAVGLSLALWWNCSENQDCEVPTESYGEIYLFDLNNKSQLLRIKEDLPAYSLKFLDNGEKLLAATASCHESLCNSGTLKIWDIQTGKLFSLLQASPTPDDTLSLSNNEQLLALGSGTNVMVWSINKTEALFLKILDTGQRFLPSERTLHN